MSLLAERTDHPERAPFPGTDDVPAAQRQSTAATSAARGDAEPRVNDLVLEVATTNGSGSQSANQVLVRTLFQMGIPVGAKNLFPSNIQGLPTWFTIRANRDGWTGRRGDVDLMVCMNPDSIADDVKSLRPGTVVLTRDDLTAAIGREDLRLIAVPFGKLVVPVCEVARLRKMVVNIMYVGVLAWLLGLEMDEVRAAIDRVFAGKPRAAETNRNAAEAAYEWSRENVAPLAHLRVERMESTAGKILIDGNTAGALGALWGGATVLAWYPITPSSSLAEALINYLHEFRTDSATGKASYAVLQAEDELAAIGMVIGAGWAGARALTATSGPGLSLMAEQVGLAYFAEIPAVIVDVQRMGPSTGLPTRTCQNDLLKTYYLSHGDCRHILLIPGNVAECFELAAESFNLAERFQTPVFVMSDLDLGMNVWMSDPFTPPTRPIERGKVLDRAALDEIEEFARYRDVDGDGIPYRTLPGTDHPKAAYFTRGTGHTDRATYTERPEAWKANIDRLTRKFETARRELPEPVIELAQSAAAAAEPAEVGVVAYGSSDPAVREALALLADEHGIAADYLRLRALPAHELARRFIAERRRVYVVDQNRDGQLAAILRAEWPELAPRLISVRHYDGMALEAANVIQPIVQSESEIAATAQREQDNGNGNGQH